MKLGVSSYSLYQAMNRNEMDIFQVIDWIAEQGGEHIEIVPGLGFDITAEEMPERIAERAAKAGIDVSSYAVGGNFIQGDEDDLQREIERTIQHVDFARRLGVKRMRHDVASRPREETSISLFEADLERIVHACQTVADYAKPFGITTSLENHGFHVQGSDRVLRVMQLVDRENYKITVDVGNFLCADENSVAAVRKTIRHASMLHLKDFYVRPNYRNPGHGWFQSVAGNYLRGAIVGQGDIDMWEVIRVIKSSGYDGYVSIEFEGMEDCLVGTKAGLDNVKRIWDEV